MQAASSEDGKAYIKWVDFGVSVSAMKDALQLDVDSYAVADTVHLDWIELLAYLGTRYGGDFKKYKKADLTALAKKLQGGESMAALTEGKKHYPYYLEAYSAVLGGFVGEYEMEKALEDGTKVWERSYGLKAYSPLARGYAYNDYDDFGAGRSYGYKRKHLGHDMMALTGTPVVAMESGVVEALGWNRYGGWRVGIRSFDGKRYFFYAHLRKDRPYADGLAVGQVVFAGDVIGYVGRTGYSDKENVNNISESHLHFGIQLIFDESQKEGYNQVWIDPYAITKLLSTRRSTTARDDETKEHDRVLRLREAVPKERFVPQGEMQEETLGDEIWLSEDTVNLLP